jgi:hypothetical protein
MHIQKKMIKRPNNLFAGTHRECPVEGAAVELACPTPFAIEEMEVGGIENVRLRCPSPITRKMNQFR